MNLRPVAAKADFAWVYGRLAPLIARANDEKWGHALRSGPVHRA
jgi:hypothetical protein